MLNSGIKKYIIVLITTSIALILLLFSKSDRQMLITKVCDHNNGNYISSSKDYFSKRYSPKLKSNQFKVTIVCEDK